MYGLQIGLGGRKELAAASWIQGDSAGPGEQKIPGWRAGGKSGLTVNVPKDVNLHHPQDLTVSLI